MSCFGGQTSPDLFQNCCTANELCQWDGNFSNLVSEPIYVQKVFDAVLFNLQGLKTVTNQQFSPAIPRGYRLKRVIDVKCKKYFNPLNADDPANLKLDINTTISGATFVQYANGQQITVIGADGTYSEKIVYADTEDCDENGRGTPIFGTQNVYITGDVTITLDLLLCDNFNHEVIFPVCANVQVAEGCTPLALTNFFELCIPSTRDTAFLPRFTEFCNPACETRLATNNVGRDICISPQGEVTANLIIALCVTCEKKIVVPVQLCVLSTGYVQLSPDTSSICTSFPQLFPNQIRPSDVDPCGCGEVESDQTRRCTTTTTTTTTCCEGDDCCNDIPVYGCNDGCYDPPVIGGCDDNCFPSGSVPPRPQPRR